LFIYLFFIRQLAEWFKKIIIPLGNPENNQGRIPQPCRIWGGKDRGLQAEVRARMQENLAIRYKSCDKKGLSGI